MTAKTNEILNQRQSIYGDFETTAKVAQEIKSTIDKRSESLNAQQREALEMIATKIARILTGDPDYKDNWQDIAGYALLGGELYSPVIEKDMLKGRLE
ncbi:DUF6378 domain-containing protein [Avibacterium sp. 20-15]|uniref:DUF6378 domain-containing protein n=1 Tax=unclassified Avibacterium TaxID=2685287 RepID=UPI0020270835|nr:MULTISPECIES: DUF6378 domain-containing protein [unclassified Avibacterium]MCW9733708.1 DUF6378 domain-containing protein [Avibacterium sp. 20-15]URL03558.1 DUF6378 domain-containing protein [Avibacterium sp. 20-132]